MKYKSYDEQYNEIIKEILENGVTESPENVRTVYADGTKATTKSIINVQLKLDNSTDKIPILTTKRVGVKNCIKESFWIWQLMSNKVQDLRDMGCNVWNQWENENGDIGRAYGWQLYNKLQPITVDKLFFEMYFNNQFFSKPTEKDLSLSPEEIENFCNGKYEVSLNQVDFLLYQLKKNPHSRRHRTTLWAVEDLHLMSLQPCVHSTTWTVQGDVLHLTVDIRSNDFALSIA